MAENSKSVRSRTTALAAASSLFYRNGVRAVGMEQVVEESGIAKTTIYRHFPNKDALIAAFLEREDAEFWTQWDEALASIPGARDKFEALCDWIGERVSRPGYRGCPQINVAAEFADEAHPARAVSRRHKTEMQKRITKLCSDAGVDDPDVVAMQVSLLIDGAFQSDGRLREFDASSLLRRAVRKLLHD